MSVYAHLLPFKKGTSAASVSVSLPIDFALVCGAPFYGGALLLPSSCPHEYLVAGGFDGIPYRGGLGRAGGTAVVEFGNSNPVSGLIVLTRTENVPVATISAVLTITGGSAQVGSGNAVTRYFIQCGGVGVQMNGPAQPLAAWTYDYPAGSIYTGPKPNLGYTVFSSTIVPLT